MSKSQQPTSHLCVPKPNGRVRIYPVIYHPILSLTVALALYQSFWIHAEDHVDYKFENYQEDDGRVLVNTHGASFEKSLFSPLSLKGEYIYDSISGATPTGVPAPAGTDKVPTVELTDIRRAGFIEPSLHFGQHTLSPQFAYSKESDYESRAFSTTYSLDLNQKNTTLILGGGHQWDRVLPSGFLFSKADKDATQLMAGITQLLGPKTILNVDLTWGEDYGYLTDPYKAVNFFFDYTTVGLPGAFNPSPTAATGERRPSYRSKRIFYTSLRQFVTPLDASIETSYRFHTDSYGVDSHTLGLAWHQKLGSHFIVSPMFRFYTQSAADFYSVHFTGDPAFPNGDAIFNVPAFPKYYSSDYRLSSFHSQTFGIKGEWKVCEHFSLNAAYQRYEMIGDDGVTSQSAYAQANILTLGAQIWF